MIRFTWTSLNETQVELAARDGKRVLRRVFDKAIFWLAGDDVDAHRRRLERELARRFNYLG